MEEVKEIKVGGWLEELCRFFNKGYCNHKDAPKNDRRCIGMGSEKDGGCVAWQDDISCRRK